MTPREWNVTLLALCLLSLYAWLSTPEKSFAPGLGRATSFLVLAIFAYAGLQLMPLPVDWLRILSPSRFDIVQGLAPIRREPWASLTVSPQITFAHLIRLLAYLLVFCLTSELSFHWRKRAWLLAVPLVLIASAESLIGLVQHFLSGNFATGTYANHGHLAGLLEMTLPLVVVLVLRARSEIRKIQLSALVASGVLILLGLVYTASRMGLAASAVSMIILAILAFVPHGNQRAALFIVVAALASLAILLFSAPLILVSRYEGGLTSEVRLQIWRDTLRLIAHYPVFGCGLGTFVSAVQKYRAAIPLALVDYAHNDYLQLLAELGAIGFALLMILAALMASAIFSSLRREPSRTGRLLLMACIASLSAIAVHSLVDFQFYIPANMMTAAWIAGLAHGIGKVTAEA